MIKNIARRLLIGLSFITCQVSFSLVLSSCSDVEIEESASDALETVSNLTAEYNQGSRKVTLKWTNPTMAGQTGVQIVKNHEEIINLDNVATSYFIKKAPVNEEAIYTVKARYNDRVSKGQTVRFNISYTSKSAMLVADDYANSADETDAVAWFKKNYVDTGKGTLVTPSTISQLDPDLHAMCWVICDRVGLERGWENLPGGLASETTIAALKSFVAEQGNLFLTNHATQLTVPLERIDAKYAPGIWGNGPGGANPDTWGVHPVIGNREGQIYDHISHPIYNGMTYHADSFAGIYNFQTGGVKGDHNCMWDLNAYGLSAEPNTVVSWEETTNSTVLGTWNHVVDYCCAGIVDFAPTTTFPGRVLAVGLAAYEWNIEAVNPDQDQLELFTKNCIEYLK